MKTADHTNTGSRPVGTIKLMMLFPSHLPTNQKNVHELIASSLNHDYTTPHYPLQGRACRLEGISPLWPPLPGKAIKLFLSISPKTLSPRCNSAQRTVSPLHMSLQGVKVQRCKCAPFASYCTVLPYQYFLRYYTVRFKKKVLFIFCACFLCTICVKNIINLLQQSIIQLIVLAGYLG